MEADDGNPQEDAKKTVRLSIEGCISFADYAINYGKRKTTGGRDGLGMSWGWRI